MENVDNERLKAMSTGELVRHALDEAKLLARAEVLHAKEEMKEELARAKLSGVLGGAAFALLLSALSVFFVMIGIVLPMKEWLGLLVVFAALLVIAASCALFAWRALPRRPMDRTRDRLKEDVALTREQFA